MVKIIGAIGDSITHGFYDDEDLGWFARLGKLILKDYPAAYVFNNLAQSGDNIADATMRAAHEVTSRQFNMIIVSLGINDLRRRKNSNLALDFSAGTREMYWRQLLLLLKQTGAEIIVTDLLPVIEQRYTPKAILVRKNADVAEYNNQICRICHDCGVKFVMRYQQWLSRPLTELYRDATHPNARGHQLIAEEMYAFLQKERLLQPSEILYD
ncbi:MAG: SGNH/GDSL hydrolase family protein [Alphaproteobacteria bacterium]|nr:SGNH/GDSL hydrolase family protein [Alphaproteobacteria bacterium]